MKVWDNWAQVVRETPEIQRLWSALTEKEREKVYPLLKLFFEQVNQGKGAEKGLSGPVQGRPLLSVSPAWRWER